MSKRTVYRFDQIDWHVPTAPGTDPEAAAEAGRRGAGRKFLAQGDSGFYAQVVNIPPEFQAPIHSHDHAEIFMVLDGGCSFDGDEMGRFDMTVVPENTRYGFTAGPDGVTFLVVRTAPARFAAAP